MAFLIGWAIDHDIRGILDFSPKSRAAKMEA
jgi:hypothetical protein